jgi:flagellar hook-associated protein 2
MDILSAATTSSSSSATSSYGTNTVTGLVDGINVDSIVSGLMTVARVPVDTLNQKVQTLQWQQQDYQTINTDLQSLQSTASSLKLQGTFLTKQASSSSSAVTATAGTSALDTSHTVAVSSLATNAVLASSSQITTITSADNALSTVTPGSFTIDDGTTNPTHSQSFQVTSSTTLNDVINAINSSGLKVQASWDSTLQRFYLTSTQPGQTPNPITATDDASGGNLMQTLLGSGTNSATGTNAAVTVDGTSYSFNSNQFTINGVSYSLVGKTDANNPATVTVSNNTSAVVSTIQSFVTAYNNTLTDINNMLTEKVYSGYTPLTQDAINTKGLDSTQIDDWNTKAKSGQLNSDPLLQRVLNDLRDAMGTPVSGLSGTVTVSNGSQQVIATANQMSVIGLTTSSSYTSYGQLTLDSNKLTQALQSNPQAVMSLFTNSLNSNGSLITDSSQQGLGTRLYNTLTNSISEITNKAGSSSELYDTSFIGQEINSDNTQISTWNTRLNDLEQKYYTEYDAMEQTLSQMNSESSWLTQMFSSTSSGG